ncbi:unnamed protein product [Didymodactylos carnosus]|uniref:NHL repeat-containing protein n=1 Tax=Didymodactylos carnosus TaxID=1234261 RepID=A0A8S2V9C2_9BILA|nr:unnamed protein product [Didymodactylos carnosus]CAF4386839.1 unnamed protein product [Didymodactylos carnosus]
MYNAIFFAGNNRIQISNYEGDHLTSIGRLGKSLGDFSRPMGIAYDEKNEDLYVVDEGNNRIQIFRKELTSIDVVHSKIGFQGPYDILLMKNKKILVSEYKAHRLQIA